MPALLDHVLLCMPAVVSAARPMVNVHMCVCAEPNQCCSGCQLLQQRRPPAPPRPPSLPRGREKPLPLIRAHRKPRSKLCLPCPPIHFDASATQLCAGWTCSQYGIQLLMHSIVKVSNAGLFRGYTSVLGGLSQLGQHDQHCCTR